MIAAIRNQDLRSITEKMENVFEPGIMEKYPVISEIEKFMEERGALKAMMSGSGPTVFGIFEDREKNVCRIRGSEKRAVWQKQFLLHGSITVLSKRAIQIFRRHQ